MTDRRGRRQQSVDVLGVHHPSKPISARDLLARFADDANTDILPAVMNTEDIDYAEVSRQRRTSRAALVDLDDAEEFTQFESQWRIWDTTHAPSHGDTGFRETPSEITQDILLTEVDFDEQTHEHPFDVDGARIDAYSAPTDYVVPATPRKRKARAKHRVAAPPAALRGGRAALIAVAAGAAVAAATGSLSHESDTATTTEAIDPTAGTLGATGEAAVVQSVKPPNMHEFTDQLSAGTSLAAANAAADAASRRPEFMSPIPLGSYDFTSCFCSRWGSFHGGIDFAAPLGTPIHAATDGVVIKAEPASGYGNWVQVRADDGTVTMYGHMASSGVLVHVGQHVTAGDVIALVGNEGFSTGPHCHFEVWKDGTTKIDPAPWLAERGVRLATYTG